MKLKEASVTRRRWDPSYEENFVESVIDTYVSLPQTPDDVGLADRNFASELCHQGYALYKVEAALLLGSVRRIFSNPHSFQPRMSSLLEFASYIEELRDEDLEVDYVRYLHHLLSPVLRFGDEKRSK
jgi:hypothetical protein